MFLVTTRKENGLPNAAMQAWSCFGGDSGGYFAVMQGVMQRTHTYTNILREKEFCINFLAPQYYDNCRETVFKNDNQADEIAIGGMTAEPSSAIGAPRIREAFLTMECTLESHTDLSGAGINSMIVGRVRHVSVDSNHGSIANICSPNAFMYNVHSPKGCANRTRRDIGRRRTFLFTGRVNRFSVQALRAFLNHGFRQNHGIRNHFGTNG